MKHEFTGRTSCGDRQVRDERMDVVMLTGKPTEAETMTSETIEENRVIEDTQSSEEMRGEMPGMQDLVDAYARLLDEVKAIRREHEQILTQLSRLQKTPDTPGETLSLPDPVDDEPETNGPRVALFVDVQSVFYNARNFFGRKMDFKRLIEVATQDRTVVSAIAYVVQSPDVDQTNFITMLQHNGYNVRHKVPQRMAENGLPAGESPMVADIMSHLDGIDVAVFVGGDGDILKVPERAQTGHIRLELYAFEQNVPEQVLDYTDAFVRIDENLLLEQEYVPRRNYHDQNKMNSSSGYGTARRSAGTRGSTGHTMAKPQRSYWSEQQGRSGGWRGSEG